jgi:rhodanese-related sulfurtransferase
MSTERRFINIVSGLLIIITTVMIMNGCEKDKITSPFTVNLDNTAKLLIYLEEEGDIVNTIPLPVVQANEVFNNLQNYLIIDVRDSITFLNGHIEGAINITIDSIFDFIKANYAGYSKVVLISSSGQSAAYYSCLFRLTGLANIYYMNYGMASWNIYFSSIWTDRLGTYPDHSIFTNAYFPKGSYSSLPELNLGSPGKPMKDFVQERASQLVREGFDEDFNSSLSKSSLTFNHCVNANPPYYTVCMGPIILYSSSPFTTNTYHPMGTIFYQIPPDISDLRSGTNLQTLPSDNVFAVYSGTGQESAFYTAYLRFLGYNARSILFGMNNIDYGMLFHSPELISYAFRTQNIMNYPYVTGSSNIWH